MSAIEDEDEPGCGLLHWLGCVNLHNSLKKFRKMVKGEKIKAEGEILIRRYPLYEGNSSTILLSLQSKKEKFLCK
jgi:hypothetical protein